MDLIILQYLLQRTLRQFGVFLWLVWLHARLCSCTFLGEILNESHKDDSLMFAVHSSLWIVLSIILKVSHFGPDVVVIVCLYLDREGLIYRVHEWCRGLHAVSTVAELCLIVLHSVLILHPHVSASGQRRRILMHGSYSDLMGFQCFKDHSTTTQPVVCFLSLHKYGNCFLSFWFYSCCEANWNVISNVTIMRLGAARCHDVSSHIECDDMEFWLWCIPAPSHSLLKTNRVVHI